MHNLITSYINNLSMNDLYSQALKQGVNLSETELMFSYDFIKNNYQNIMNNPASFNFNDYAGYYSEENFIKISNLIEKYRRFL